MARRGEPLGRALVSGRRLRDLIVVEFCDTADARGYYRKYCAFLVGDRVLPRRFAYGRPWMLKYEGSEFTVAMAHEEAEWIRTNPHAGPLAEIHDLAGVGYGTIDYSMKGGRVVVWEINLAPRIGPGPGDAVTPKPVEVDRVRQPSLERFYRGFREALEAVDLPSEGPAIALDVDPGIAAAARASANHLPSPRRAWIRALKAARPALEPAAARVLLLVGRWARRRARRDRVGASEPGDP